MRDVQILCLSISHNASQTFLYSALLANIIRGVVADNLLVVGCATVHLPAYPTHPLSIIPIMD